MSERARRIAEALARRTGRRGLLSRGAQVAFGTLAGAAAGRLTQPGSAIAGNTTCAFPFGRPCPCDGCLTTGVCAKPCFASTEFYASGCWVTFAVTCCDCDCANLGQTRLCGCGSDYHNDPALCP